MWPSAVTIVISVIVSTESRIFVNRLICIIMHDYRITTPPNFYAFPALFPCARIFHWCCFFGFEKSREIWKLLRKILISSSNMDIISQNVFWTKEENIVDSSVEPHLLICVKQCCNLMRKLPFFARFKSLPLYSFYHLLRTRLTLFRVSGLHNGLLKRFVCFHLFIELCCEKSRATVHPNTNMFPVSAQWVPLKYQWVIGITYSGVRYNRGDHD